ncbi:MAG: GDP-mannose 4,6-dehydratase [Burkholderiales bacterium]
MSSGRRALITGITGQDGRLLAEFLLARGYEVAGFGRRASILARPELKPLFGKLALLFGDLNQSEDIVEALQRFEPHEVYNLAAQSAPGESWNRSLATGEVTGLGAHRLFEAVRRFAPACRVYQASSSEMFGKVLESPQTETTPFNPSNPYAVAKAYAHMMAHVYRQGFGMFISCGILFNHESPYRPMRFLSQKIAHGAACAKLGITRSPWLDEEGEPVVRDGRLVLGNLDAQRDWGSARDSVDAMWRMLQHGEPDDFVIGTGQLRSVREMCDCAYTHVGLPWQDHVVSDPRLLRPAETGATVANPVKAAQVLGWRPSFGFAAMMSEMVDAALSGMHS